MKVSDKGGSDFKTVEAGTYVARCYRLIDLGTQQGDYQGTPTLKREIVLGWEFPTELMDDGKPFITSAFFTASLGEKANLRKFLASWRGKDFTPEELLGFEMKNLLGVPCTLNMITNKKGKVVVGGVTPLMKGMTVDKQINPTVFFSLDDGEFDPEVFNSLVDFFKTKIMASPEFKALHGDSPEVSEPEAGSNEDEIPF